MEREENCRWIEEARGGKRWNYGKLCSPCDFRRYELSHATLRTFSPLRHPFLPLRIKCPMSKVEHIFENKNFPIISRFYLILKKKKTSLSENSNRRHYRARRERREQYALQHFLLRVRERERERVGVVNGKDRGFSRGNRGGKTVTEAVLDDKDKYIEEVL